MKQLPNLFTLLNLLFGSLAVIFMLQNGITISYTEEGTQLVDMPEQIWMASLCIGIAAVVDFLDGFVARLFKATSSLGKQLDSLADVISFGLAPGIIIYQFLRMSYMKEEGGIDISIAWLLPALLIPCAAAFRLAKFNIDEGQQYSFKGIPTPAVGLLIASLPLIYWNQNNEMVIRLLLNKWLLYAVIIMLSYLMVSNIPIMSLKFKDFTLKTNLPKLALLLIAIVLIISFKWLAAPFIFVAYIALSLFGNTSPRTK